MGDKGSEAGESLTGNSGGGARALVSVGLGRTGVGAKGEALQDRNPGCPGRVFVVGQWLRKRAFIEDQGAGESAPGEGLLVVNRDKDSSGTMRERTLTQERDEARDLAGASDLEWVLVAQGR